MRSTRSKACPSTPRSACVSPEQPLHPIHSNVGSFALVTMLVMRSSSAGSGVQGHRRGMTELVRPTGADVSGPRNGRPSPRLPPLTRHVPIVCSLQRVGRSAHSTLPPVRLAAPSVMENRWRSGDIRSATCGRLNTSTVAGVGSSSCWSFVPAADERGHHGGQAGTGVGDRRQLGDRAGDDAAAGPPRVGDVGHGALEGQGDGAERRGRGRRRRRPRASRSCSTCPTTRPSCGAGRSCPPSTPSSTTPATPSSAPSRRCGDAGPGPARRQPRRAGRRVVVRPAGDARARRPGAS